MTRLKILSVLIKRPLLLIGVLHLAFSICYVNLWYSFPVNKIKKNSMVNICGIIEDFSLSPDGNIGSFIIKNAYKESRLGIKKGLDVLCYVNSISLAKLPKVGSLISVSGKVSLFQEADNPGQFDFKKYYERKHIVYSLKDVKITKVFSEGNRFSDKATRLRLHFSEQIKRNCPLEYGTINTILWADKSNLPDERKDLYKDVGLAHFLVISGLHIQALGSSLYILLRKMSVPRSLAAFSGILLIILYGFFVGFQVSVLRAVIMFAVRLFADIIKAPYDMLSALSLAMILSLIIDPFYCVDTGFIYSFTCVLAVALYFEKIYRNIKKPPLAVIMWLFLLPLSLFFSYRFSLLGIALNILLGIFSLPLMIISFLCFLFSLHNIVFLAGLSDFSFALIIRLMDKICLLSSKINLLTLSGKPPLYRLIVYYSLIILFILFLQKKASPFLEYLTYLILVLFLVIKLSFVPQFTMLSVGQGDCMVFSYMPGSCVIFDAGSSSLKGISKKIILPYLNHEGIRKIANIYISHSDSDHINAIGDLIDLCKEAGIEISQITISDYSYKEMNEKLREILEKALNKKIHVTAISQGTSKSYGPVLGKKAKVSCLWPQRTDLSSPDCNPDANYYSLLLHLSYGKHDVMLTGDLTAQGELQAIKASTSCPDNKTENELEILKVAHHGSKYSSTSELLNHLRPRYALVSVGLHNSYGHPHPEALKRLNDIHSHVYRTDFNGAITYFFKGDGLVVIYK